MKAKLEREGSKLGSVTTRFKFAAPDDKKHAAAALDHDGIIELAKLSQQTGKPLYRTVHIRRQND